MLIIRYFQPTFRLVQPTNQLDEPMIWFSFQATDSTNKIVGFINVLQIDRKQNHIENIINFVYKILNKYSFQ